MHETEAQRAIVPAHFYPRSHSQQFYSEEYPRLAVQGHRYAMLPECDLQQVKHLENELKSLKANRFGWLILAAFGGVIGISLLIALVGKMFAPAVVTVEKPIIVEKPVPVSTNCIAFCK